ncbi:uncharacterized protein G2W53_003897 [Senna tora]|uniref:Uncharacterized protein n=1 Tax=Senna tora TaxID=362788 RepID=A0A834XAY1_9FABA|nr:uncharacterized protein G2W53_003897 [Senna tora]
MHQLLRDENRWLKNELTKQRQASAHQLRESDRLNHTKVNELSEELRKAHEELDE